MSEKPLLEVRNLEVCYGEARALTGITFDMARGELVAIIGANGAGKTTLIRAIAGMLPVTAGTIAFHGAAIQGRDCADVCERGIGQVAEGRQIFPSLSIAENLDLGGSLRRSRARKVQNLQRVFDMFPRLSERRRQKAGTLSGGEQQMLAIGRCLMAEPELIMFDEPSLGLSPLMVEHMFEVIRRLKADGLSVLLVEQNVAESLELADRAAVLENGEIVLRGAGAALMDDERVRGAYLGL
jgi:branched-chain amino acid transport system ATP-binding protein